MSSTKQHYTNDVLVVQKAVSRTSKPNGLCNKANTCFINTIIQCLISLDNLADLFTDPKFVKVEREHTIENFFQLFRFELKRAAISWGEEIPMYLKEETITAIYAQMGAKEPTQQDACELLSYFMDGLTSVRPDIKNRFIQRTVLGHDSPNSICFDWIFSFRIEFNENKFDLTEKLSNSVHVKSMNVCTCKNSDRVHIYGELPECFIVNIIKLNRQSMFRSDIQIMCSEVVTICGQKYRLKSMAKHERLDESSKVGKSSLLSLKNASIASWNTVKKLGSKSSLMCGLDKLLNKESKTSKVKFCSSLKRKDPFSGNKGHYRGIVQRGGKWYDCSDNLITKVKTIQTDGMVIFFFEKDV